MSQNISYRLPKQVVAVQLTSAAGHTVTAQDIDTVVYDNVLNQVRVNLKPVGNAINKITEFFTFTRTQAVNFYNTYAGTSIVASTITDIRIDVDDGSFVELLPAQT